MHFNHFLSKTLPFVSDMNVELRPYFLIWVCVFTNIPQGLLHSLFISLNIHERNDVARYQLFLTHMELRTHDLPSLYTDNLDLYFVNYF